MSTIPISYTMGDGYSNKIHYSGKYPTKWKTTRISSIKRPDKKIILLEGSNIDNGRSYVLADWTYFPINSSRHSMTKNVSLSNYIPQGYLNNFAFNFLHDDIEEFWVSNEINIGYISLWESTKKFKAKYGTKNVTLLGRSKYGSRFRAIFYVNPKINNNYNDLGFSKNFKFWNSQYGSS